LRDNLERFAVPDRIWTTAPRLTSTELDHLLDHAESLIAAPTDVERDFREAVKRIYDVTESYYVLKRARIEADVLQSLQLTTQNIAQIQGDEGLWEASRQAFEHLRKLLNVKYVAFFVGETESDTVLRLRAFAGSFGGDPSHWPLVHFNWRKAGLRTGDERDGPDQNIESATTGTLPHDAVQKGFKGSGREMFTENTIVTPVRLATGPFAVLVIGPNIREIDLRPHLDFLTRAAQDLATRILTFKLASILRSDRTVWRRTAQMTGHRVRASLQALDSNLRALEAYREGRKGFDHLVKKTAEQELAKAYNTLCEVSYAAESEIPGTTDVRIADREPLLLMDLIAEAEDNQRDFALRRKVHIDVAQEIENLHTVRGNAILLKFVFINLINNAIKYSRRIPDSHDRIVRVKSLRSDQVPGRAIVRVINYGRGIKNDDLLRVFDWGVRLVEHDDDFRSEEGKGWGLWECRHVIEGHGGRIYCESRPRAGGVVNDQNINQCTTEFVVDLGAII
jgi:signal transduction histidine kinase